MVSTALYGYSSFCMMFVPVGGFPNSFSTLKFGLVSEGTSGNQLI